MLVPGLPFLIIVIIPFSSLLPHQFIVAVRFLARSIGRFYGGISLLRILTLGRRGGLGFG
jgi:hypothetical protein